MKNPKSPALQVKVVEMDSGDEISTIDMFSNWLGHHVPK